MKYYLATYVRYTTGPGRSLSDFERTEIIPAENTGDAVKQAEALHPGWMFVRVAEYKPEK